MKELMKAETMIISNRDNLLFDILGKDVANYLNITMTLYIARGLLLFR
jgi:hypothetical protein